ncbi:MAG: hypothetical protein V7638_4527, partial [Acidobacteriota bacterium]
DARLARGFSVGNILLCIDLAVFGRGLYYTQNTLAMQVNFTDLLYEITHVSSMELRMFYLVS